MVVAAALGLLALGTAIALGVRTFDVQTPSMGRTAPVGSLVLTVPAGQHSLAVGDVVTFVPPVDADAERVARLPYTHRITAITDGSITTRGDANGAADAWTITRADVVGRVVTVLPGVGWLLRMLPWGVGGIGALWIATGFVRGRGPRVATRLVGTAAVLAGLLTVFRPLVALVVTGVDAGARPVAHVVSTGLLPIRAVGPTGSSERLASGATGQVPLPPGTDGAVALSARLDLTPSGWVVLAAVCAVPLVLGVLFARPRGRAAGSGDPAERSTADPAERSTADPAERPTVDPADTTGAVTP